MIVERGTSLRSLLRRVWRSLAVLLVMTALIEVLYYTVWTGPVRTPLPVDVAGALVTALTIFISFRVSEAYGRWWEARTLWGKLLNLSRSWARTVLTLRWPDSQTDASALARELVHRHIAYVNALRIRLRVGAPYRSAQERYAEWEALLSESDLPRLRDAENVPAFLLLRQAEVVKEHIGDEVGDRIVWRELNGLLTELTDVQGGCERIKSTAFPDAITFFSKTLVWFLCPILLIAVLEEKSILYDVIEVVIVLLIALVFILIEALGQDLKNPFDNKPNDTPMSSLCRTIEIDLRQHLGEEELPEPVRPVKGILM